MIRYIISKMMGAEGLLMLLPMLVGIIYGEHTSVYFLITAAILTAIYLLFGRKCPENMTIYAKEGLIIVATAWIFWSLAGALPFVLSKSIPSYVDAFFETVSGFTTTGSTILTEIEGLPKGILFWRSLTHWVGGMGVLVFVMVLTSLDEKNSMHLMRAEVPGPEADKLVPKARGTARILYGMYFALTAIEVVFLLAGGMNLFDAVTHAFSTAGTGGFSGYNASVAHFNSAYIDGVITVFMILFGINFNLYFFLLLKEFKSVFKNEELRAYLGIIAGATVVITCNIAGGYHSLLKAFRYAAFQVASVITTTGFVTADFNKWPELSKCVLLLVMVIGASNRVDMIDPAVLRPGRLDVKIRVGRPKTNQAIAIVDHYLTDDLPLEDGVDAHALSAVLVHDIYGTSERRHLCDVQEENGQWHALFLADVVSGAMLKNIVDRAKTRAVKESIETGLDVALTVPLLAAAVEDEYRETRDSMADVDPEQWSRINGMDPIRRIRTAE